MSSGPRNRAAARRDERGWLSLPLWSAWLQFEQAISARAGERTYAAAHAHSLQAGEQRELPADHIYALEGARNGQYTYTTSKGLTSSRISI